LGVWSGLGHAAAQAAACVAPTSPCPVPHRLLLLQTALAANTAVQLPAVDRDALTAALREAWGVQPWVSCDSA
jgi:hypothetical protein